MTILAEQNKTAKLLSELTGKNICFLAHWCTAFSQSDEKTLFRIAEILHLDESGFIYMRKQDLSIFNSMEISIDLEDLFNQHKRGSGAVRIKKDNVRIISRRLQVLMTEFLNQFAYYGQKRRVEIY